MTNKIDEYQVIIKLEQLPHRLRLTYPTNKSQVITQIEELDALENVRCSCKFKGRSYSGDATACAWLKDVKSFLVGMKPQDFIYNDCFVDAHYRIY